LKSEVDGSEEILVRRCLCVIFTTQKQSNEIDESSFLPVCACEKLHPARFGKELCSSAAPISVTRLWTACTRLKMRGLQIAIFD
jgi:hypothetical protein